MKSFANNQHVLHNRIQSFEEIFPWLGKKLWKKKKNQNLLWSITFILSVKVQIKKLPRERLRKKVYCNTNVWRHYRQNFYLWFVVKLLVTRRYVNRPIKMVAIYLYSSRRTIGDFRSGTFAFKQPPEVFCRKGVLKNFANLTGKHLF